MYCPNSPPPHPKMVEDLGIFVLLYLTELWALVCQNFFYKEYIGIWVWLPSGLCFWVLCLKVWAQTAGPCSIWICWWLYTRCFIQYSSRPNASPVYVYVSNTYIPVSCDWLFSQGLSATYFLSLWEICFRFLHKNKRTKVLMFYK